MTDWKAKLKALGPCPEAYEWAIKHKTLREAWRMCERGDWMNWLLYLCERDVWRAILAANLEWGGYHPQASYQENTLCDAYIILDFMPSPPRLPEIAK